jgi:hypothetical protein
MFIKYLVVVLGLIGILITAGCNSDTQTGTPAVISSPLITKPISSPLPTISFFSPKTILPKPPNYVILSIPSLPKPGETADFIINVKFNPGEQKNYPNGITNTRVWTEFYYTNPKGSYSEAKRAILIPPSKVVIEGLTSWEGDLVYNIQSSSKIRLPLEGVWQIMSYFASEKYQAVRDDLYFASLDGYALDLINHGGQYNIPSYLRNFGYGTYPEFTVAEGLNPIALEADISMPPKVGEEAVITCRIKSLNDVPDFSAQFKFFKRRTDVDGALPVLSEKLLVQGDLSWKGDLKANQTTEFSATIKFPETGEWQVYASGNFLARESIKMGGFAESILINISDDISSYGWEKRTK